MVELYLVTDEALCLGRPLKEVVESAARGGVTMVQLREKDMKTRDFVHRAAEIKEILAPYGIPLIINDRIDVALAVEADGVHIGQSDLPYRYVRKIVHDRMIVGLSVETVEQAVEAEAYDLDYLSLSPLFFTPTKTDLYREWGIEGLEEICRRSRHKVIAIGGINASNAAQVIGAGADGVSVVSAICSAPDPERASRELISIIREAKKQHT
ncbi:MAG: thiamine phosphate synthase [Bacteroidales bacterium]